MTTPKEEIIALLNDCIRPGIAELIDWLENKSDFFTAPGSTKFHCNYVGGLADHSLNVYDALVNLNGIYSEPGEEYNKETIAIVALLHDLCKANYYLLDEDPATSAQIKYMNDLLSRGENVPEKYHTKAYVSKVIEAKKADRDAELPQFTQAWKVKDQLPMGHGEKSLYLIQKFIELSDEEALAIRWHLGAFDPGFHFHFPTGVAVQQAIKEYRLVPMLIAADYNASWLVDVTVK